MSIPVEPIKIPNPSRISGQALSQKTRSGWGTLIPFDPEYSAGAFNAVNVCLRLQASEQVSVITDQATIEIAASIVREIEKVGASYHAWVLEELAERPLKELPREILDGLETSQVSIFAVQVQTQELRSRIQMTDVVNRRKIRHAHMVNINRQIMLEGMRADFGRVDRLSQKIVEMVRKASTIHAKTAAGTDLTAELNPNYKWLKTSGIISPEKWGNLPRGEIFTTPGEVNGTFVIDGVVGDYLCARYGLLDATPLTIEIKNNRVGEFAIGPNFGIDHVIGNILQDEKFPGIHIAFGNPYGEHTGAPWTSTTHIDVVGLRFNIWVEEEQIMKDGVFLVDA